MDIAVQWLRRTEGCLAQGETPAPQDKAVLRKLERKEILEKTESGYNFQVPLIQNYVEQVIEEE